MLNTPPSDADTVEDAPSSEVEPSPNRLSLDPSIVNPWRSIKTPSHRPYRGEPFNHAAPLSPLRDRDLEIMATWFDRVDMIEVQQDLDYHLSMLYPEPPWEEELDLNFLEDHL